MTLGGPLERLLVLCLKYVQVGFTISRQAGKDLRLQCGWSVSLALRVGCRSVWLSSASCLIDSFVVSSVSIVIHSVGRDD
jgi:hypothetical protein